MGTYTDRERELIEEGYDPDQAIEISADEEGGNRFWNELDEDDEDD